MEENRLEPQKVPWVNVLQQNPKGSQSQILWLVNYKLQNTVSLVQENKTQTWKTL